MRKLSFQFAVMCGVAVPEISLFGIEQRAIKHSERRRILSLFPVKNALAAIEFPLPSKFHPFLRKHFHPALHPSGERIIRLLPGVSGFINKASMAGLSPPVQNP